MSSYQDYDPWDDYELLNNALRKFERTHSKPRQFIYRLKFSLKKLLWMSVIGSTRLLKRAFDIVVSGLGMICLSPLFLLTTLAIKIEDPGPVIYRQTRIGKWGKEFPMYKFRSMVINADQLKDQLMDQNESGAGVVFKMKNDPRITKVGRIIRKLSIDELPQLFNVLRGDMSLVGPRPQLPREVAEYRPEDRKRLDVVPGITCLWQIGGRSDIDFDGQVRLDVQYIQEQSFRRDLIILLKTVPAVLLGKGAY